MRVLIVKVSSLGDIIHTLPAVTDAYRSRRGLRFDWVVEEGFTEIPRWHPAIDKVIPVAFRRWRKELYKTWRNGEFAAFKRDLQEHHYALGKTLFAANYDQAIVLPNSFKSALIPWFADIPLRTGWRGEKRGWLLNDCRDLDKAQYPLMVQRFAALAYPAGSRLPERLPYPALQPDMSGIATVRQRLGITTDQPVLVLCPGAEFGPAKQWPAQHYARIADYYTKTGWQVWLLGSEKDSFAANLICQGVDQATRHQIHNLCGVTSLSEAVQLLALARAVVSNDSGLMHIAAALNRPLVVVYGSTSPGFTPPLAEQVVTLSLGLSCSPCFKRECPLQHLNCLRQLEPQQVLSALQKLVPSLSE